VALAWVIVCVGYLVGERQGHGLVFRGTAIRSRREAQRLGRLGGKESARGRVGDSEWGRRMRRLRGARTQQRCYPTLHKAWARNANRARWGKPPEPVPLVMTDKAVAEREARRLKKRREDYDRERARGAPFLVSPRPIVAGIGVRERRRAS
jgi:hypothetical protein